MICRLDYTEYAQQLEPRVNQLQRSMQLKLAIECVERVVGYCERLDETKRCHFALEYAKISKHVATNKLKILQSEVDAIQSLASKKLEETDYQEYMSAKQNGDQRFLDAYDEIMQVDFAASAVSHILGALLETEKENYSSWCYWAISLSWAAKLGSAQEKEWQNDKINSMLI